MGQYFDIILFAMIAGFLVLRLRSVLGRRTGLERRRDTFAPRAAEKVVAPAKAGKAAVLQLTAPPTGTVAAGLAAIRQTDSNFDPGSFLAGARTAFAMIVEAFARGDAGALRPLLGEDVFRSFAAAIQRRQAAGETLESRIERIEDADITRAGLAGGSAQVTVRFVSRQVNVTRAADGTVLDGEPEHPSEKIDLWTFARETRSTDPNWVLVATESA